MSELTVNIWHRKGHHRLYVRRPSDRASIGYWDLAANEPHPNHPGDLDILLRRVRQWRAEHPVEAAWWMNPGEVPPTSMTADPVAADVRERRRGRWLPSAVLAFWERARRTDEPERNWRSAGSA